MRTILSLLAAGAALALPVAVHAKTWSVGCAGGFCVAVDTDGGIAFIDLDKQAVAGVDKLTDTPKSPFSVSCGAKTGGESCVIIDGEGKMWFGPVRPGTPYKIAKDKLP